MILDSLINFIKIHHDYSVQFTGAFLGAFFAFLFYITGEWLKRKSDWQKAVKNEHAYLERYFGDVYQIIQYNKGLLPIIIEGYEKKEISNMNFNLLPVRGESTMKMEDTIFINRMEIYLTELKRLNLSLDNINKWKNLINEDLLDESERRRQRGAAICQNFLKQAKSYQKVFDYHLDKLEDIIAENEVLLKKYKKWKYDKKQVEKEALSRKELIAKEKIEIKKQKNNPIFNDHLNKLKEFGLYEDKQ